MTRKMKDSGVEWIGEIPATWRTTKYKYILEESKNSVRVGPFGSQLKGDDFKDNGYKVFNQRSVLNDDFYEEDTFIDKEKFEQLKAFKVNSGDILITTRGTIGKIAIAPKDVGEGIIHPCIIKTIPNMEKIDVNFLKYIFNETDITLEQFILDSNATTIPVIYSEPLKNVYISLPKLNEQNKIVNYLNNKCNKIDQTIEKEKQVIEKLKEYKQSVITEAVTKGLNPDVKMKDSGVEWIGEIPEHWRVMKIKHSCNLNGRIGWQGLTSAEYKEEGPYLITGTDFKNGAIDWNTCVHITEERYDEAKQIQIKDDDLLITKDGTIGKVAIVSNLEGKASLNGGVLLIRPIKFNVYITRFMYYMLLSRVFWMWFESTKTGNSTIIHLYQEKFKEFSYTLPLVEEQQQIADYLDKKCSAIDKLITNKGKLIEKLTEYKKSLIYECVTGKREVQ